MEWRRSELYTNKENSKYKLTLPVVLENQTNNVKLTTMMCSLNLPNEITVDSYSIIRRVYAKLISVK